MGHSPQLQIRPHPEDAADPTSAGRNDAKGNGPDLRAIRLHCFDSSRWYVRLWLQCEQFLFLLPGFGVNVLTEIFAGLREINLLN